jgi:hypothetical protein
VLNDGETGCLVMLRPVAILLLAGFSGLASLTLVVLPVAAEPAQAMSGNWELSNSERDRLCNLGFRPEPARQGLRVEFDPACVETIPALKDVEGWALTKNMLRLLDARGRAVFELSEVEVGMYEGERSGEGLYFLQTAESAAAFAPKRAVEDMTGEWTMVRGEKPVCVLTMTNKPTKGFDEFLLALRAPCDPAMMRLNPNVWRIDRGELVLAAPNGQSWRFAESEPKTWRRVPEGAEAIALVKK